MAYRWKSRMMAVFALAAGPALGAPDDTIPPPPPNPFSNLPSNGAESFAPFDDDFGDDGFGSGGPDTAFLNRGSRPQPPAANTPPSPPGAPVRASGTAPLPGSQSKRLPPPASCKEEVENFDYPDAEILDVAKAIAKLTGKNFIYNPQEIKGRVSIVSQTRITVCDAWNAFLTVLNTKQFAIVPSGKYLRIERIATAREKQTPIYADRKAPNTDEFITRVLPLRYIDASEFENAFRLWMPREARIQAYQQTNTIIITDTAAHIARMVELISLLDVAGYQESLVVIPIRNAAAKDIAKLIENILREGAATNARTGFGVQPRPANPYGTPARTGTRGRSGGSTISKIIADDRTNALIVKANMAGIQEIRALVRRLDTKVAVAEGSGRIHVVSLRFANAEELGKVLQTLTTGGGGARPANRAFPTFGEMAATFQNEIKIAADKTTQSLVITASPQDFNTLKKVIERLDQPRDQVFIEAMILEMGINRDSAFGVSFFNSVNGLGIPAASGGLLSAMQSSPPVIPSGFVLGFKSGMSHEVQAGDRTYRVSSFQGLLELIQSNADAQVIATPQVLVLDNEKATFEVSEQVPVEKTTLAANGSTQNSYELEKASLSLIVTPQINKGSNFVKLDIDQKLENLDTTNVPKEIQGKATGKNTRATTTKVFVQSDDTVVLSGMIRSRVDETIKKVPILGDIPVLGWLFKNSSTINRKTNLMVFITPRIIKQYDKIRQILARKLSDRDEFVRETQGSIDPFGREVNRLKKNLPDLTVIEPLPQSQTLESSSFQGPSAPDRDDAEEDYNDPNAFYPPPFPDTTVPLDNSVVAPPSMMPPPDGDNTPPPVLPEMVQ